MDIFEGKLITLIIYFVYATGDCLVALQAEEAP
jgi:hypothetical protein